jgi:Holliday junction resolvase-like predicted endonuclease
VSHARENAPSPSPRPHRGPTGAGPLFTRGLTSSGDFTANDKRGAGLLNEVARVEKLEAELNAMIERRALRASGEQDVIEQFWRESSRRVEARTRRENRARWHAFHLDQAERIRRTMAALISEHEAKASALLEGEGA